MNMIAHQAVQLDPCKGFDYAGHLTEKNVDDFVADDHQFGIRYVARKLWVHDKPKAYYGGWLYGLSTQEANIAMAGRLAIGVVQSFSHSTAATYENGFLMGTIAAANLLGIGVRARIHLFCDLEHARVPDADMIAYLNGWSMAVIPYFRCGLYVGYHYLNGRQLYGLPRFDCYWSSAMAHMGDPQPRGFAMKQGYPTRLHGCHIDPDELTGDNFGKGPYFLKAA
ncbi:hypothetical protein LCGC14_0258320 [marine sediment metagenome]|uniref:DUF1906 domain-containing protein n=1 Tax=marine sediment metagenome TaxID=412755 RepID=A0A0F9UJ55_9ZZZZ